MIDANWFDLAIVSAICFGIYSFIFKHAVEEKADIVTMQMVMTSTVIVLSVILLVVTDVSIGDNIEFIASVAFLQGVLFYLTTITRLKAFEYKLPSHILFPIIKTSTVLIIIISAFIFDEFDNLTEPKTASGILLAIISTYLLIPGNTATVFLSRIAIIFAFCAMISSAGASIASKYLFSASELDSSYVNIFGFMLLSNLVTLLLSTGGMYFNNGNVSSLAFRQGLSWGAVMGLLNFIGFAAFLQAVKYGDLSLVAAINAMYILIPIILSAVIYKEKLRLGKKLAVLLSIVAIALIKN